MATTTSTASIETKSGKVRSHGSTVIAANAASIVSATVIAEAESLRQAGTTIAARVNDDADIVVNVQGPVGAGTVAVVVQSLDA